MAVEDIRASRIQPTFRVETPEELTVSVVGVKTLTITEAIVANKYVGQVGLVTYDATAGGVDGTFFNVVSNTGGAGGILTLEEDLTGLVAAGDKVAIRTRGQPPQDAAGGINDYFGVFKSNDLPMRIKEFFDGYYHGGELPKPEEFVDMANGYDATLNLFMKNVAIMALAMGECIDSTADYNGADPADPLNTDAYPGSVRLDMGGAVDARYSAGKIIHITGGATGTEEVAKIDSTAGNFIILVDPLKNFHSSEAITGAIVHEIDQTVTGVPDTVITHTITIGHGLPTFTLEAGLRRTRKFSADNDIVMQFLGLIINSIEFKAEPGQSPLEATIGVQGLAMRDETDAGVDLTTLSTKTEVGFDKGTYLPSRSVITIDGTVYGEAEGFSGKIERTIDTVPTHNDGSRPNWEYGDPWDHYEGNVKVDLSVSIPLKNRNFIDMVKFNDTPFDVTFLLNRNTTETLTFTFEDCRLPSAKWNIPEEGRIPQAVEAKAKDLEIESKDFIPYYVL